MIEEILPSCVAVVDTREDWPDVTLHRDEQAAMSHPVETRRREFATGRECARRALECLGLPRSPIPSGANGEPRWPDGVVGSITHCRSYRGSAVARSRDVVGLGIDAEPHEALPEHILGDIVRPEERRWLEDLRRVEPTIHWDRLLFCAKEAVYKTWFPLTGRWLGFHDATLLVDADRRAFTARLLLPGPILQRRRLTTLEGRWLVRDELLLAAIALPCLLQNAAA